MFTNAVNKLEAFKVNYRPGLIVAILTSFLGTAFNKFYWKLMNKVQGKSSFIGWKPYSLAPCGRGAISF